MDKLLTGYEKLVNDSLEYEKRTYKTGYFRYDC